jgi:hypothetical protein
MSTLKRDENFARQVAGFDLRYRCQDCTFVLGEGLACSMGFPNHMLLDPRTRSQERDGVFVFCKYFELEEWA